MNRSENRDKMLEVLRKNPIVEAACAQANVGRTTFYRWMREDREYARAAEAAMAEGREFISDAAESRLIQAIKNNQLQAISLWLRHNRSRYGNRVELSGSVEIIEEMSPEDVEIALKALTLFAKNKSHEPEQEQSGK